MAANSVPGVIHCVIQPTRAIYDCGAPLAAMVWPNRMTSAGPASDRGTVRASDIAGTSDATEETLD